MTQPRPVSDPADPPRSVAGAPALVVAQPEGHDILCSRLEAVGLSAQFAPDPYAAAVEVAARPMAFRAVVLSLAVLYPEELALVGMLRRRFGHLEVIATDVEGRAGALAEAVRLGAHALLVDDRLHRIASATTESAAPEQDGVAGQPAPAVAAEEAAEPPAAEFDPREDAVLSPEELRALLQEP